MELAACRIPSLAWLTRIADSRTGDIVARASFVAAYFSLETLTIAGLATWRYFGSTNRQPGAVMGLYLVLIGAERFTVEFFRVHQQGLLWGGPLSTPQWISLGLMVLGFTILAIRRSPAAVQP